MCVLHFDADYFALVFLEAFGLGMCDGEDGVLLVGAVQQGCQLFWVGG